MVPTETMSSANILAAAHEALLPHKAVCPMGIGQTAFFIVLKDWKVGFWGLRLPKAFKEVKHRQQDAPASIQAGGADPVGHV